MVKFEIIAATAALMMLTQLSFADPTWKSARDWAKARMQGGTSEQYAYWNPVPVYQGKPTQPLDVVNLVALPKNVFVNQLTLVASGPSGPKATTVQVIYKTVAAAPIPLPTTLSALPAFAIAGDASGKYDIQLVFSGPYSIAHLGVGYAIPGPSPTPGAGPPIPPAPTPTPTPVPRVYCSIAGVGLYNGLKYNFRVTQNGTAVSGNDTLEAAIQQLLALSTADDCLLPTPTPVCTIAGYGEYGGMPYNYQLLLGGTVIDGEQNFKLLRSHVLELLGNELCVTQPAVCLIEKNPGAQTYGAGDDGKPFVYKYALFVGPTLVDAFVDSNQKTALTKTEDRYQQLRGKINLCQ